jgi:heme-degrading monooxygenase HmoA
MFATIFRMKTRPGQEHKLKELGNSWTTERQPQVTGFVASYIIQSVDRPGEFLGISVFDSEENFRKNAADPAQDRWYRQLRENLEVDPEWNDGPVISYSQSQSQTPSPV